MFLTGRMFLTLFGAWSPVVSILMDRSLTLSGHVPHNASSMFPTMFWSRWRSSLTLEHVPQANLSKLLVRSSCMEHVLRFAPSRFLILLGAASSTLNRAGFLHYSEQIHHSTLLATGSSLCKEHVPHYVQNMCRVCVEHVVQAFCFCSRFPTLFGSMFLTLKEADFLLCLVCWNKILHRVQAGTFVPHVISVTY
jgi:hypothetical protein